MHRTKLLLAIFVIAQIWSPTVQSTVNQLTSSQSIFTTSIIIQSSTAESTIGQTTIPQTTVVSIDCPRGTLLFGKFDCLYHDKVAAPYENSPRSWFKTKCDDLNNDNNMKLQRPGHWHLPVLDTNEKKLEMEKIILNETLGDKFWIGLTRDVPANEDESKNLTVWRNQSNWRWLDDPLHTLDQYVGQQPWLIGTPDNYAHIQERSRESETCVFADVRTTIINSFPISCEWQDSVCDTANQVARLRIQITDLVCHWTPSSISATELTTRNQLTKLSFTEDPGKDPQRHLVKVTTTDPSKSLPWQLWMAVGLLIALVLCVVAALALFFTRRRHQRQKKRRSISHSSISPPKRTRKLDDSGKDRHPLEKRNKRRFRDRLSNRNRKPGYLKSRTRDRRRSDSM